jgi:DNA-binding FadR family transcriptional regulator
LVEVRVGSGAYVRVPTPGLSSADLARSFADSGPSPSDLINARKLIEGEIAAVAATTATQTDLTAIEETLSDMRARMDSGGDPLDIDRLFHARIAAATGNSVLPPIVDGLWANVFSPVFDALSRKAGLPLNHEHTIRAHTRIFRAIQARDPDAARAAMRAHLTEVEAVLFHDEPSA